MKYAINLSKDGRALSATYEQFAYKTETTETGELVSTLFDNYILVDNLPDGELSDYLIINGEYVYSPLERPTISQEVPTQLDRIEAQTTYTAIMTGTLMEE